MKKINFAIALHNHQPVGNFDHVFEDVYQKCYRPFLEVLNSYPRLKMSLHYTGALFDWLMAHHPEFIDNLKRLSETGQVEVIGGGYYEPVLALLARADRVGQIRMQAEFIRKTFGQTPPGIWLTERVWEQGIVSDIADAGVKYTLVDDSHIKFAGVRSEAITGYYITEDQGRTLKVFPMDERLRYYIPFQDPEETIRYLRGLATETGQRIMVYADDGEKFGSWPQTYKHIYEDGWLKRFLDAIERNSDWIETVTLSEAVAKIPPIGKVYIPDASYREMMEWALPTETHEELTDLEEDLNACGIADRAKFFIKGASWRNFQSRYEEAAEMYAKMTWVSRKVAAMDPKSSNCAEAKKLLYMGQCNDAYWHGVFGGLYLPHLRNAVYEMLIKAETLADPRAKDDDTVHLDVKDYNFDGHDEAVADSGPARIAWKPFDGGHMFQFDVVEKAFNVLATLTRRREAYHRAVLTNQAKAPGEPAGIASIHDAIRLRDPEVRQKIVYDWYKKEALIDHFFGADTELKGLSRCRYRELGDFVNMPYAMEATPAGREATIKLTRHGALWLDEGRKPFKVEKTISLKGASAELSIEYALTNESEQELSIDFGVEFNYALMGSHSPDRYYVEGDGRTNLGPLATMIDLPSTGKFAAVDEWKGVEWWLELSQPAALWAFPVETASMSEYGIELVYQCSTVIPHWKIKAAPGKTWRVTIVYAPRLR